MPQNKIDYYIDKGYNKEESEELSVKDMGHPKEVGIQLNKQHNPLWGWVLWTTNGLIVFSIILGIIYILPIISVFAENPINDIPEENIEYRIDLDEQVKIDHRVIDFTNIVYEKNGDMNIIYTDRETGFFVGRSLSDIGKITDNLGNEYIEYLSKSTGGIKNKSTVTINDFPEEADKLIIDYDRYNRLYRVEIPLQVGDNH